MSNELPQINPATGESLPPVASEDVSAVPGIIERARAAQQLWAARSHPIRALHVQKNKQYIAAHADRACDVIVQSTGKPRQEAFAAEVLPVLMACDWYAEHTAHVLRPRHLRNGHVLYSNKRNTLYYEPMGVVAVLSPWNYPFTIPFGEILMALMAGNAVVLKVASNVTHVGAFIADCLRAAELPEGLFHHLVLGGSAATTALLAAGVDKLFFTGSVAVGKEVAAKAAATLTPVSLELGGNDALIVLDDADVERAVNCACWGAFVNAGQTCAGVQRVLVHTALYDVFVRQLSDKTRALRHGVERGANDIDMGAVTTRAQLDKVRKAVDEAVAGGARIVAQSHAVADDTHDGDGDKSKSNNKSSNNGGKGGFFYPATVLVDCTPDMTVMREEVFGPVVVVVRVRDESEAVAVANSTSLGLTGSVFTRSAARGRRVAAQLRCGVVMVNDHMTTHAMAETPWGGYKDSGLGRTHGAAGLLEMCHVKCVCEERLPSRWLPRNLWWHPYSATTMRAVRAAVAFASARTLLARLRALWSLLRSSSFMRKPWRVSISDSGSGGDAAADTTSPTQTSHDASKRD